MTPRYRILPIPLGVLPNSYAVAINLDLDSEYVLSAQLVDQNGNAMGTAQTVDLPLESVIVNGRYDDNTQSLILVLDNGNEITIPVSGLVAGLQAEITSENPLSADLVVDGTTNKVFTATEQTKLSGIETGAEVNVQADWNQADNQSDDFIKNKPTLGTMAAENASDYTPTSSLSSVALSGSYNDLNNKPDLSIYAQSANLATVATSGSYTDLSNTPTIPTVNDATITLQDSNGTSIGSFTTNDANNRTITIPAGGGGNTIYTSEEEYDAMPTHENADYQLRNKIDYEKDVINKPLTEGVYASKNITEKKLDELELGVGGVQRHVFLTQAEYDLLPAKEEGVIYVIEGQTLEMVVTFQDQSTATYNVVID